MKEGKIEKISKKEEPTGLKELIDIKKTEEQRLDEDPQYNSAWRLINPEKLTKENQEIYVMYKNSDLEAAQAAIKVAKENTKQIKEGEERMSNTEFLKWIDDVVELALAHKQNADFMAKDNI